LKSLSIILDRFKIAILSLFYETSAKLPKKNK